MILYPLCAALLIMLASLSGVVFASKKLGGWMDRNLALLITFSIGVFSVITWGLFVEVFEHTSLLLVSALVGMVFVRLSSYIIPDAHHHHEVSPDHEHSKIDARHLIMGDAIHNIVDGMLLVPAFLIDIRIGIATTVGILLHEIVQEVSEFFIMKRAGYTTKQALTYNFIASSTILIGVILSFALSQVEFLEAPLIGFAAGGFLYVILRDLIPHTIQTIRKHGKMHFHAEAVLCGLIVMIALNAIIPHSEVHEKVESGAHTETNEETI